MKNEKRSGGQSLFEVVFAMGIAVIIMLGIVSLASVSIRNSSTSRDRTLATRYAQEAIEWVRSFRDTNSWIGLQAYSGNPAKVWCVMTSPPAWPDLADEGACDTDDYILSTKFKREVALVDIDSFTIEVTVTISWHDTQGDHVIQQGTRLTDWQRT